ncbi:MAG: 2-C-methyl-D-erythritol 4-phosphate cytidylyltransferase [Bacteroidota bacterium]|nr:2-C-methyl-D-erythritol 4-phosphate cytidylyltransferase [Bacteroidota bacterium]
MKKFVIIVAGGSGSRMGSEIPKQFLELCGKPVLMHTIQVLFDFDPESELILALPADQLGVWAELCLKHSFSLPHQIVSGGETRFHSVQNGLKLIQEEGIVFIHDGVRPLVSLETLERCNHMAQKNGNAIPVLSINESLRKQKGLQSVSVDRTLYLSVQTPQTFRSDQILKAYEQDFDTSFTDDASVAEKAGFPIFMVDGNRENIKITNPTDLIVAEVFLRAKVKK